MKKLSFILVLLMFGFNLFAASVKDKDDVTKALVIEAAKFAKEVGKQKAIAEFNHENGKFIRGEFYIFALDMQGVTLANYKAKRLIGKNLYNLRDLNREHFVQNFIKAAQKGDGWVVYYWKHPIKKRVMKKKSYILRVDKDYFIGCGYYIDKKQTLVGSMKKKEVFVKDEE